MVERTSNVSVTHAMETEAVRLSDEFGGVFSPETVRRFLTESYDALPVGPIQSFRPLLAGRFARERLKAVAQANGQIDKAQPEVLFVCVHNAGRSQMAAALTATLSEGRVSVRSAGSMPANSINPVVIEAMAEVGIDISAEYAKPLTDEVVEAADVVITMGCGDACPIYPGKRYLDWVLDDPAGRSLENVRPIRDQIEANVRDLLRELGVG